MTESIDHAERIIVMKRKLLGLIGIFIFTAFCLCGCGAGNDAPDGAVNVTVFTDVQTSGTIMAPYAETEVNSGIAEAYGFTDSVSAENGVSALDVMVALHEKMYGEAFTADSAGDYLSVEDGWINLAFECDTASWSVLLNGESAHGDNESSYGGFEALTVDQTEVKDGDLIEFVSYQDTENYADNELWILKDGEKVTEAEIAAGEELSLEIKGYSVMMLGAYGTDAITAGLAPVADVMFGLVEEDGSITPMDETITGTDGKAAVSFDTAGTYVLMAYSLDGSETPCFASPLVVTVK